jgi:chromobox protein 1
MIEYEVEKIMAHRNKKGKLMEYHIKWLGYENPADDSWEPEGVLVQV